MFNNLSSEYFNLIEGCFWILLSLVCLAIYFKVKNPYRALTFFSVLVLFTFGISDFVEAFSGSFLVPGMEWLFIWKILDVVGLCVACGWYIRLRLNE